MAYIDFSEPVADGARMVSVDLPESAASIGGTVVGALGCREWDVVRLARTDGLRSLRDPSWMQRLLGSLFGREVSRRLADPRLEALRRVAVLGWRYGYALPVSAIKDFKAAGFSMDQLEILLVRITTMRAGPAQSPSF